MTQDTNSGAGSVGGVPVGWMRTIAGLYPDPSIYTPAVLERGTPILPGEEKRLDLFWDVLAEEWLAWDGHSWLDTEARANLAWLRPHAAPPQESDKGRGCGQASHDRSGEAGEAASLRADAIRSRAMRGEPITDAERCLLAWGTSSATDRASFERGWEAHRFPADVVTVPREEWEAVHEFADLIVPLRDNLAGISWAGKLVDVFAAYDRWYAVRIHADQAPDALRSGEAGKERE